MKRLALSFSIALLSFMAGLAAYCGVYGTLGLAAIPEIPPHNSPTLELRSGLDVHFLELNLTEHGPLAKFRVSNRSSETAYYPGYSKDTHCADLIRYDFKIEKASHCWCGTGLEEQSLEAGESVEFVVGIPNAKVPFAVGFDFGIGQERVRMTFWSKQIDPQAN